MKTAFITMGAMALFPVTIGLLGIALIASWLFGVSLVGTLYMLIDNPDKVE